MKKTLTDEEINGLMDKIIDAVSKNVVQNLENNINWAWTKENYVALFKFLK